MSNHSLNRQFHIDSNDSEEANRALLYSHYQFENKIIERYFDNLQTSISREQGFLDASSYIFSMLGYSIAISSYPARFYLVLQSFNSGNEESLIEEIKQQRDIYRAGEEEGDFRSIALANALDNMLKIIESPSSVNES